MSLVNSRTGRSLTTKYAHQLFGRARETLDEGYPGDVIGLVNAADVQIGDTLSEEGDVEGVIQVLRHPERGDREPILAAVGPMQFEVASHRLPTEFGADVELSPTPYTVARRTDADGAARLAGIRGVDVLARSDGITLALFRSAHHLESVKRDHPDITLDPIIAT